MNWFKLYDEMKKFHFYKFIEKMKEDGTLEQKLPEVFALIETPERLTYHEEGNTYSHTILVLKQVDYIVGSGPNRAELNFCALCHDLGKALTPKDILPKHIGHENRGVDVILSLCDRLDIPISFQDKAILTCRNHMAFLRCSEMRPSKLLRFVDQVTDGFKRSHNLNLLFDLCYGDSNGRICNEENKKLHDDNYGKCMSLCKATFNLFDSRDPKDFHDFVCHNPNSFSQSWNNFKIKKLSKRLKEMKRLEDQYNQLAPQPL